MTYTKKEKSEEMLCFEVLDVLSRGPEASPIPWRPRDKYIPYNDRSLSGSEWKPTRIQTNCFRISIESKNVVKHKHQLACPRP
jgi:hypothetical protein